MELSSRNSNKIGDESVKKPIKNSKLKNLIKRSLLLISTLTGVAIGIVVGVSLRPYNLSDDTIMLITYPGELFLRMLKLVTLPMLISSLITVSANLNARMNGKIVSRTIMYFAGTSMMSAFTGICIAMLVRPGEVSGPKVMVENRTGKIGFLDSMLDLGRNLFPDNIFQATFQQSMTTYVTSNGNGSAVNPMLIRELTYRPGANTMGIVVFCLAFGTIVSTMGERGQVIKSFFSAVFEVTSKMTTTVIWFTGFAVAGIIIGKLLTIDNMWQVLSQLALFIFCVLVGLAFHLFVLLPLIYFVVLRKQSYGFLSKLADPMITAFAVASSAVTLPTTLRCMSELKNDSRISKFVLTLGVNLNTNGTAMFLAISSIFIARLDGAILTYSTLFTILLMTTISSMSTPSAPSASLVMLLIILATIDVDARDISLLFAVDWILDRCRTTINVVGDCFAVAVLEKFSQKDLMEMDADDAAQPKSEEKETLIQTA